MQWKAKYVVVLIEGFEQPIVFNELIQHRTMALSLATPDRVVSGGFCHIDFDGRYQCYGESTSLKVKSRGEVDGLLLNKMFGVTPVGIRED